MFSSDLGGRYLSLTDGALNTPPVTLFKLSSLTSPFFERDAGFFFAAGFFDDVLPLGFFMLSLPALLEKMIRPIERYVSRA
jgi:hypothetical protein